VAAMVNFMLMARAMDADLIQDCFGLNLGLMMKEIMKFMLFSQILVMSRDI